MAWSIFSGNDSDSVKLKRELRHFEKTIHRPRARMERDDGRPPNRLRWDVRRLVRSRTASVGAPVNTVRDNGENTDEKRRQERTHFLHAHLRTDTAASTDGSVMALILRLGWPLLQQVRLSVNSQ